MTGIYSQISQSPDGFYDAFGRARVSSPTTLFDSQMEYDAQPLLWVTKAEGAGAFTHLPNESATTLDVGTASGDAVTRQTRAYFRYQPGKSQFVLMTFTMGAQQDGTTKLVGYGDGRNGVFVGQDGGGVFVLLRSNITGTPSDARKVYQSDWNVDRLDGSSPYEITLDFMQAQIFVADMEWLGVGRVRVGFNVNGVTYAAHEFLNANNLPSVYMTTANLPCRYEIRNTQEVAAASSLKQICCSIVSEGGLDRTAAYPFSAVRTDVAIPNGAANAIVVFAARHKLLFNGIENRVTFLPKSYEVLPVNGRVVTRLLYNPALVGGTWADIDAHSAIEGNMGVTSFSGGIAATAELHAGSGARSGLTGGDRSATDRLPFGLDIDGSNPVPLALTAYALENNVTASFAFDWEEVR